MSDLREILRLGWWPWTALAVLAALAIWVDGLYAQVLGTVSVLLLGAWAVVSQAVDKVDKR